MAVLCLEIRLRSSSSFWGGNIVLEIKLMFGGHLKVIYLNSILSNNFDSIASMLMCR